MLGGRECEEQVGRRCESVSCVNRKGRRKRNKKKAEKQGGEGSATPTSGLYIHGSIQASAQTRLERKPHARSMRQQVVGSESEKIKTEVQTKNAHLQQDPHACMLGTLARTSRPHLSESPFGTENSFAHAPATQKGILWNQSSIRWVPTLKRRTPS
jgi:hypothetical protein